MDYKETVMTGEEMSEQIQLKTKKWAIVNPEFIEDIANIIANRQAEISFKAGEQLGIVKGISLRVKDMSLLSEAEMNELNTIAENYLEAVSQEGRREVVEWILSQNWKSTRNNVKWQHQLKEWGLKED